MGFPDRTTEIGKFINDYLKNKNDEFIYYSLQTDGKMQSSLEIH